MAKKRKRPNAPAGPRPAGAPGTKPGAREAKAGAAAAQPVRVRPAEPGGPNRQVRKQEARERREAIRRRQARHRYYRIISVLVAILVAAGAVTAVALVNRKNRSKIFNAAECGVVQTMRPYSATEDRTHIAAQGSTVTSPPPLSRYPSQPPTSGPHLPPGQWTKAGVYSSPPDVYGTIHSLEHGAVVIWYSPTTSSTELSKIKSFYQSASENDHVIVAPYNYPSQGKAGQLPAGKQMVLVAWHRMMQCGKISLDAVKLFVSDYRTPTGVPTPSGYKGDAPEAGASIA